MELRPAFPGSVGILSIAFTLERYQSVSHAAHLHIWAVVWNVVE